MARTVKCPHCSGEIERNSYVCKHCGKGIDFKDREEAKKEGDTKARSGCLAIVVIALLLFFAVRACSGNNETANVVQGLPTHEDVARQNSEDVAPNAAAPLSTSASSQTESGSEETAEIPVLSDEELVRVRSKLNDHDLQETVYARCQEQGRNLFSVPTTADWPELRWGFFGNPLDGIRTSVTPERQTLQIDVEVASKDEYSGNQQSSVQCLYALPTDEVTTTLVNVVEPASYPVYVRVDGRNNTTSVWLYEVKPDGDSLQERFISNGSTSGWDLEPGDYSLKVEDFWSKAETVRFKVPARSYPSVQLQALPRVPVTFASNPPGVTVTLPDESVETTPFTVELPRGKRVEYKANYKGSFENRTKQSALNVATAATIDVTLASPTVPVSFTSKPAGVNVTLPDESIRTTPFTIDLPENTTVEYDAEYKGQFERRSKSGEVNVSKSSTIDVTLASPTVPVTFTSTPPGVIVTLPDNESRTTPFTVNLPKDTALKYRATKGGATNYRSKNGTLKVSEKTTYKVALDKITASPKRSAVEKLWPAEDDTNPGKFIGYLFDRLALRRIACPRLFSTRAESIDCGIYALGRESFQADIEYYGIRDDHVFDFSDNTEDMDLVRVIDSVPWMMEDGNISMAFWVSRFWGGAGVLVHFDPRTQVVTMEVVPE